MRFEDLDTWKRAARLAAELSQALGSSREFGFKDQVTRSALSVAANIAEGHERDSGPDRVKFLSYAKGSCAELGSHLLIGIEVGYMGRDETGPWIQETRELSAMIYALIRALRER